MSYHDTIMFFSKVDHPEYGSVPVEVEATIEAHEINDPIVEVVAVLIDCEPHEGERVKIDDETRKRLEEEALENAHDQWAAAQEARAERRRY